MKCSMLRRHFQNVKSQSKKKNEKITTNHMHDIAVRGCSVFKNHRHGRKSNNNQQRKKNAIIELFHDFAVKHYTRELVYVYLARLLFIYVILERKKKKPQQNDEM